MPPRGGFAVESTIPNEAGQSVGRFSVFSVAVATQFCGVSLMKEFVS